MSLTFHGKAYKGAMRHYREEKRYAAYERQLKCVLGTCPHDYCERRGSATPHQLILVKDEDGILIYVCNEESCEQVWDPRKRSVPESECPWKPKHAKVPDPPSGRAQRTANGKKKRNKTKQRDSKRHSVPSALDNTRSKQGSSV